MDIKIFEQAKQYALERLERELPPSLHYHSLAHTHDDVVPAAVRLAEREGVKGEALLLLLTAAWFHDIGFVEQSAGHEAIGSRIAAQVLPGFGYTATEIEEVRRAIMATALPQSPTTLLEQILADADLDVLGREDFLVRNNDLRQELALLGKVFTDEQWYSGQIEFMEKHQYFTASARLLREAGKAENISRFKHARQALTKDRG